ncbi:DUF4062 domain-containing protein [Marinobacter salicampi]|uniref:DUF4062 domain-containing protein n=1 Tax=Marinobacter salicampi TaxID=435907 RepID=UPI00140E3371|nr:DUF4062 domain-containing protein [Marinobacter salicampi]
MTSTRKIIRAFLASPGDLQDERYAIRGVVNEFNESWANELGLQIELMGWEETVAGFGRPQQLINQELDRCDLFLGMIWKRWGTPPDLSGEFSSGFEEEYLRSLKRREIKGNPEISLFFKQVPDEFMVDPGNDLKKVLKFRDTIIAEKQILFQNFSTVMELESLVRKCITAYVIRFRDDNELSERDEPQVKRTQPVIQNTGVEVRGPEQSPLSAQGFAFLESMVEKIRQSNALDIVSASDVARFRLQSNLISKPGNEEMNLGVHDINILFSAYLEDMGLGRSEIKYLVRLGFQHLDNENVPLWSWYSALADSSLNRAVISSITGVGDSEKVGALWVLKALDFMIRDNEIRENVVLNWFSDKSSAQVRTAALEYLSKCGSVADLDVVRREYERSDYGTSRSALECMIEIMIRSGQLDAAREIVMESQFATLNAHLLRAVLAGIESLESAELFLGIEHRNSQVRLSAMQALIVTDAMDVATAELLTTDSDPRIRYEAVLELSKLGKPLDDNKVKQILVTPTSRSGFLGLEIGGGKKTEKEGEVFFKKYQLGLLWQASEEELKLKAESSLVHDDAAYFVLAEKFFSKHADGMRQNVDDRFRAYFEGKIRRMEEAYGLVPSIKDLIKKMRGMESFLCKTLTRQGLDILCSAKKPEDLRRIRTNLRTGYAESSKLDAEYLQKHGEWIDIPLLTNGKGAGFGAILLGEKLDAIHGEFEFEVAKAITSIGKKHSVSDLLCLEMPDAILKNTIDLCSEKRFAKISEEALLSLLNNESEKVRKSAALLTVRALPAKRIRSVLAEYVSSDKYRYYNVIHWLDLGVSMSRDEAKKVARAATS